MAKEKFWLVFEDEPNKKYFIDEPIGYAMVDHSLLQKENGFGRDVSLNGDKLQLTFSSERNHYLDKLLYLDQYSGFESKVGFFNQVENGDIFSGELDFYTSVTNGFNYFDCSVILRSDLQVFKRRGDSKVDLFSSIGINREPIEPLQPISMLLQAKPSVQISRWTQSVPTKEYGVLGGIMYFNITQSLVQSDISDSFVPFEPRSLERSSMQILSLIHISEPTRPY